ncbi:MAG: disulfide bond formation protein DsbA [Acidimicrobiales bacterium]
MTARWVVDVVQPERDLSVTWQPISLLFKNEPSEDSDYYAPAAHTHKLLRVMESVKTDGGNDAAFDFYWEAGRRVHHDETWETSAADILEGAGLSTDHASAFDDESFDAAIRTKMDAGLDLVGSDVGTPIIAFDTPDGKKGIFGPVITRAPAGEEGLALWDAMVTMATMDGFWELKRTRTERPDFGKRP